MNMLSTEKLFSWREKEDLSTWHLQEGHPSEVMSLSFCGQALACEWLVKNKPTLTAKVYTLPEHIDDDISRLQLEAMGTSIDELTEEQRNIYLHGTLEPDYGSNMDRYSGVQ